MNTDALRYWGTALSPGFTLDANTFLIASLIPLSYSSFTEEADYLLVDMEDIEENTSFAEEGVEKLVVAGFAKWYGPGRKKIVIGSVHGRRPAYLFMGGEISNSTAKGKTSLKADPELQPTLQLLEELYGKYLAFCTQTNNPANADFVFGKVNNAIKVAYKGKFTPQGLMDYMNGVNAMFAEWVSIPKTNSGKDYGVAKVLIEKIDSSKLIRIVPFFVTEYHKFARKGWEETSIFTLNMTINTVLTRMSKTQKSKAVNDDTDTL